MSALDDGDLSQRLDRYRQVASGIETRLVEARDRLAVSLAEVFAFLSEVETALAAIRSDSEYEDALVRSGVRAVLDALEVLRALVSLR
jgi:hypothetical protein